MAEAVCTWSLGQLADLVGGECRGPSDLVIERVVPAGSDDLRGLTFAESDAYLKRCLDTSVGAIIVYRDAPPFERPAIVVESPREAFGAVMFAMKQELPINDGVHETAVVSPDASIDDTASVGPYCVVERGAKIGRGVRVYPFCYVGERCEVGADCVLYPHVVLYQSVTLGSRCIVHSSAVIGADGFGFHWDGERHAKVPQVGSIVIGDDVEVGAGSCIDRATCGETRIGDGVKLDNLVQIAHNVTLGAHSVMASQVGIGGSSRLGSRVMLGGQAAVSDHIKIADGVVLGGRSGAFQDVQEPGEYFGTPVTPMLEAMRMIALQHRLPELLNRIKKLESEVAELRRSDEL
ncbi:MAG: UDP-3-O-(3-hydroxymyristoyl)glucosamine N-acyltransferase [Armatimonadetes bacterium]|nr:UDP-3-O-(3-hydroxymyristoyl)glucosamine N-acyltransferase [Armatimonadota bacterium]